MRHYKILLSLFAAGLLATVASAHEAKIIKLSGSATVSLPGQPNQPVTLGMMIPQGATIKTGADGEVFLETFNGGVATIAKGSTVVVEKLNVTTENGQVTLQEAQLDLRIGNIVSTLDPNKKKINKYGVKTPKGVAAARGTVLSVSVDGLGGSSVTALTGTVIVTSDLGTFTLPVGGGEPLFLAIGSPAGTAPTNLKEAIATNPALAAEVVAAVKAVATNVATSTSAVGGSGTTASATDNAAAANTATAIMTAVTKAAVNAVTVTSSSTDAQKTTSNDSITAITRIAVIAVSTSGSAASSNTTAVQAITEAIVTAAPNQAGQIAKSVAAAVVDIKVTEAVNVELAKQAASGTTDKAALNKVAQDAATATKETIQIVAQTAYNAALGSAVNGKTSADDKIAAAQLLASEVSASTSQGSNAGATNAANTTGVTASSPNAVVNAPAAPTATVVAPGGTATTPEQKQAAADQIDKQVLAPPSAPITTPTTPTTPTNTTPDSTTPTSTKQDTKTEAPPAPVTPPDPIIITPVDTTTKSVGG